MRLTNFLLTAGLVLMPALGAAQQADADARLSSALEAAARAEIPVELLENKIAEGRAKRVPEGRIAAAVEARLDALTRAHLALEQARAQAVTAGELSLAADALQAGVSEAAVGHVMTRAPHERRGVATAVLTQLVQLGVGSDVALARVSAALEQGRGALVNLPAQASGGARSDPPGRGRNRGRTGGPPDEIDAGVRGGIDLDVGNRRGDGRGQP